MNKLEKALNQYYEYFDSNYPLSPSDNRLESEVISDIELCIETGKEAKEVAFEDDADY